MAYTAEAHGRIDTLHSDNSVVKRNTGSATTKEAALDLSVLLRGTLT